MKAIFLENSNCFVGKWGQCHTHTHIKIDEKWICGICFPTTSIHVIVLVDDEGEPIGTKIESWFMHKQVRGRG